MNENASAVKRSKMDAYIGWFEKWMPGSFLICLGLTVIIAILSLVFTDTPFWSFDPEATSIVSSWVGGFWSLLAFTMQMCVLMATGNAVASAPPVRKALSRLASLPNTRAQYIIMAFAITFCLNYVHWGLGMMGGIVIGKELAVQAKRKGLKIHTPIIITSIFLPYMQGCAGMSGAAVLYASTPGYLKGLVPAEYIDKTPDVVSLTQSVVNPHFTLFFIIYMIIGIVICLAMHPKDEAKIREVDDSVYNEVMAGQKKVEILRDTPANKMNGCRWIMYVVGGIALAYSIYNLVRLGLGGMNLNTFNFLFLGIGMVLCANYGPEYYGELFREGAIGSWMFILQFPFYAGIFGMITGTGFDVVLVNLFTSIATPKTWPIIAFIYSGLMNIAVPSGGSKFVIEAPYIVPTTIDLGVDLGRILRAYQMGDCTTNMIIPFFALPFLSNFKAKFSDIVPYTLPVVGIGTVMTFIYLLIF